MILHQSAVPSDWVFIMSHGFRGSKDGGGRAVILADEIAALGVHVVRYDFTPLKNLTVQIAELTDIVDCARGNIGTKIILMGRSMGGCASLIYAARHQDIKGLCLWSTPAKLHTTFRLALGSYYDDLTAGKTVHIVDEYGTAEITPDFMSDFDRYDFAACIRQINMPLFTLHGSKDAIVPLEQAQHLYTIAHQPKKMTVIQGADHQFSCYSQQAQQAVLDWLRDVLAASI